MTNPVIVGALNLPGYDPLITSVPPGFVALFVWVPNVYKWCVIQAVDIARVTEGDEQGRRRRAGDHTNSDREMVVRVQMRDGHVDALSTATMQEVLTAMIVALKPDGDQMIETVNPNQSTP